MITKIYALCHKSNVRYIGKTTQLLCNRLAHHLFNARRGIIDHRCNWIRSLLRVGELPNIQLIGEVDGDGSKEEIAWIKYFRDEGVDLVNGTEGGELPPNHKGRKRSIETRQRLSIANTGKIRSEECRRRQSERQKGMVSTNKGKHASDELKHKLSIAHMGQPGWWTGKKLSQETCRKIGEAGKGRTPWNKGEHPSAQTLLKMSEITKKWWHKRKELGLDTKMSLNTRQKLGAAIKESWRKRRELGTDKPSLEDIEKRRIGLKEAWRKRKELKAIQNAS